MGLYYKLRPTIFVGVKKELEKQKRINLKNKRHVFKWYVGFYGGGMSGKVKDGF